MLTGLFPPTSGYSYLFGMDIVTDIYQIQNLIGICPQDDVLWPEMSAYEHFRLYARFKGMDYAEVESTAQTKLKQFDLQKDAHKPSTTFSGGMKRRLSVGLASVGDPQFIVLDEPTTVRDIILFMCIINKFLVLIRYLFVCYI